MELPPGFRIPDDASGAEWLRGRAGTKSQARLEEAFPSMLTDFVRVLHPGSRRRHGESVPWHDALGSRGHELTAGTSWFRDIGDWTDEEFGLPETDSLPQPEATVVASIVAAHTGTPQDCWFQWSPVRGLPFETGTPIVRVRGPFDRWRSRRAAIKRSHEEMRMLRSIPSVGGGALVQGPLGSLIETAPTPVPALWWPADHAWLVATGVDAVSTYIAGTPACIDAIASEPRLESLRLTGTDTVVV